MRLFFFLAGVVATVAGGLSCSVERSADGPPDPMGIVRIGPPSPDAEESGERPIDYERSKRTLAKRFPGLVSVDFARILVFPEERAGNCWTEVPAPWETEIDLKWNGEVGAGSGSGFVDLKAKGWWPTYRAPEGFGTERRARFDALEVNLGTTFSCHCVDQPPGETGKLEVRFRWKKGEMPEVSGAVTKDGERGAIRPRSVYGHFLTWDFVGSGKFPIETRARCGVHAAVSVLNTPPIL